MKRRGVSLSRLAWVVAVVWITAIGNAVLVAVEGQWWSIVPSLTACIASAGWFMAARQWSAWKVLALSLAERIGRGE